MIGDGLWLPRQLVLECTVLNVLVFGTSYGYRVNQVIEDVIHSTKSVSMISQQQD